MEYWMSIMYKIIKESLVIIIISQRDLTHDRK